MYVEEGCVVSLRALETQQLALLDGPSWARGSLTQDHSASHIRHVERQWALKAWEEERRAAVSTSGAECSCPSSVTPGPPALLPVSKSNYQVVLSTSKPTCHNSLAAAPAASGFSTASSACGTSSHPLVPRQKHGGHPGWARLLCPSIREGCGTDLHNFSSTPCASCIRHASSFS